MITDHISNRAQYYWLGAEYKTALDFFATVSEQKFDKQDIQLDNGVLVKCRPMNTKEEKDCAFEAHHEYADIHFVAYGEEKIGYAPMSEMKETSYNAEKDAAVVEGDGYDTITLKRGYFMITLPQDAHMPCIAPHEPGDLGKMIAKIKVK